MRRLVHFFTPKYHADHGFSLPIVIIVSVAVLSIGVSLLQNSSSILASVNSQYYLQLANEAALSGATYANFCYTSNGNTQTWGPAIGKPYLTQSTDCAGNPLSNGAQIKILNHPSGIILNFQVGDLKNTTSTVAGSGTFVSTGAVQLLSGTTSTVRKTYTKSVQYRFGSSTYPKISGGAGWQSSGHIGFFLSVDNQLYGYGDNTAGQLTDTMTPSLVITPAKITLPSAVTSVKKVISSGQGASFVCIIGNDNNLYCRGAPGDSTSATGVSSSWKLFNLSAYGTAMQVTDVVVNGYGYDSICAMAAPQGSSNVQAYCAGDNYDVGRLGNGTTTATPITAPTKFILPGSLTAVKMYAQDDITCVVASDQNAYCAGQSDWGQIPGSTQYTTATPVKYQLPSMGSVARYPKDILMEYHGDGYGLHILASDGTVWSSGYAYDGDFGDGTSGTSATKTGAGAPVWFGQKGDLIRTQKNTNACVDDNAASSTNGTAIQLWTCSGPPAQGWFFATLPNNTTTIYNPTLNKCIDDPGSSVTPGTALQLYDCNGTAAQQWTYNATTGEIRSGVASNICLDIPSGNTANGTRLQIYTCNSTTSQQFSLEWHTHPWKAIISGTASFCAIRDSEFTASSGMWCAGDNTYGELMNVGTTLNNNAGAYNGGVCQSTGGIWNANIKLPAAVDYSKLTTEWQYQYKSLQIIATDGQVYGAGANDYGKLGNGTTSANQCQTVQFKLPSGVTAIDMSTRDEYSTYVLGSDGKVYAAGRNDNGQLGIGSTTSIATPQSITVPHFSTIY